MKIPFYFLIAVILLLANCQPHNENQVEGTWKLVSAYWIFGDTTVFPNSEYDSEIKIIGKKHYLFIRQDTTNRNLFFSGGGTYIYKNNLFSESMDYNSWGNGIEELHTYKCKFEKDNWILTGPVNENGEIDEKWKLIETWKRID